MPDVNPCGKLVVVIHRQDERAYMRGRAVWLNRSPGSGLLRQVDIGALCIVLGKSVRVHHPRGYDATYFPVIVDGRVGWASDVNVVGTGDEGKGDYFVWDR